MGPPAHAHVIFFLSFFSNRIGGTPKRAQKGPPQKPHIFFYSKMSEMPPPCQRDFVYAARCDRVMANLAAGKPPLPKTTRPTVHQQRTVAIFAAAIHNPHASSEAATHLADVVESLNPSWTALAGIWNAFTHKAAWNGGFTYELDHYRLTHKLN